MSKYGLRDWTRDNYQSFVDDLSKVRRRVDEKVAERSAEIAEAKAMLPASRVNLPRPQRFAGRGNALPLAIAKKQAQINRLAQPEVADLLSLIDAWTAARFSAHAYERLMARVEEGGDSDLEQRVVELMFRADGNRILAHDTVTDCWLFNLEPAQQATAIEAFNAAIAMTDLVVGALAAGLRDDEEQKIFERYFRAPATDAPTFAKVSQTFGQIQSGLNGANVTRVVLSRGAGNLGRDSIAYVRPETYPANKGALVFLGPDFWRQTSSMAGGPTATVKRGATIVHEVSHYFPGTEDVEVDGKKNLCYGAKACARLTREQALVNADTYCLFAQEIHLLGVRRDAELARGLAELDELSKQLEVWL